ncbi:MAG: bifunctional metallophosphatase/5'-nucleotidase [Chloroflexi bacterium]|nr:bifunctional metallophosphatase/5'-nucleotidase [Chloroflexota bacterium]
MAVSSNVLHLIRGTPNPVGASSAELFLLAGDATQPIDKIIFDVELPARRTDTRAFHLRILHINDLHGRLARVTACDHAPIFSRIVSRVRDARRADDAHTATLFFSAGDDLTGTAFEELLGNDSRAQCFNPAYRLFSEAGVDIATLGNHEFDIGTRLLAEAIRNDARFPIVCANLTHCARLNDVVFPAAILVVKNIRVGIIGLATTAEVLHRDDPDFCIVPPIAIAQNLLPAMRPLCDVVIVLSHLGYSLATPTAITRDAGDVELAQNLPAGACDVIIGAHTHTALNACGLDARNVVNDIVIAQAGAFGEWLGEVDLVLNPRATIAHVALHAVNELPADDVFERDHVQPIANQVEQLLAEELGCVEDVDLRAPGTADESPLANFVADAIAERCRRAGFAVDFAMIDETTIACDLESGVITFEDWFAVMPHADVIRLYQMRGDQLQKFLDDNARRAARNEPGFVRFSRELRYAIDRDGARDVRVNDIALDPLREKIFLVACSSFARQRDTTSPVRVTDLHWQDTPLRIRDELRAHIRAHGGITARRDERVKFL